MLLCEGKDGKLITTGYFLKVKLSIFWVTSLTIRPLMSSIIIVPDTLTLKKDNTLFFNPCHLSTFTAHLLWIYFLCRTPMKMILGRSKSLCSILAFSLTAIKLTLLSTLVSSNYKSCTCNQILFWDVRLMSIKNKQSEYKYISPKSILNLFPWL